MQNLALLIVRLTVGSLLAGHGAQKLFGWFEGPGLEGTSGMMEKMNLQPARPWALLASLSEFGGGVLTALGLLNPLGPLGIIGAMSMATVKAHWRLPIWTSKGGAELPLTNIAVATAVALSGPGAYSLDGVLGIRLPRWLFLPGLAGVAGMVAYGAMASRPQPAPSQPAAAALAPAPQPSAPAAPAQPHQPASVNGLSEDPVAAPPSAPTV